jgi:mediator of RNA polymerase II transcription subunit 22
MSDVPQTDVSRPSALPTAKLLYRGPAQPLIEQNSAEYLDAIEEEWNKKVDLEIETLVDGMVDFVSLASVSHDNSSDFLRPLKRSFVIRSETRINFVSRRRHSRPSHGQSRW